MASSGPILLIDDEPALLRLMQTFLERKGYQVTAVGTGTDALAAFAPAKFSVAVTDIGLPDMEGDELARTMLEQDTAIKVLLCSGWPFDVGTLPAGMRERAAHLQKPFLPAMFVEHIERLLAH